MVTKRGIFRALTLNVVLLLPAAGMVTYGAAAQAQTATTGSKIGTVTTIAGSAITLKTDAGQSVAISVAEGARILQLAPGSKDLKSARIITLNGIAVGDRVLISGQAGEGAGPFTASRVILMKAQDIAQQHESEQADWQKRGKGGLVSAVDDGTGTLTVSIGPKKVEVHTSAATKFRRYSGASVKFEDAEPGTLAQIRTGDQLRVLGTPSEDGASIQAEIVVSGSFLHLAGIIASIDAANGTLTLKDLATKRIMTVKLTADSNVRKLPPQAAMQFAARARGDSAANSEAGGARPVAEAPAPPRNGGGPGRPGRSAGMDLSQMLGRLPTETLSDLKVGDAVMIVASQSDSASSNVSAVTLLSGVEPILAATPSGSTAMTLSPWNVGGGEPDAGGGAPQQ